MAGATELPQLISEFVDMSKEYLRQETVEPAQRLGRLAGFTIAASILFAVGSLLLTVAGVRWIIDLLPDGAYWSGLGYILAALAIAIVIGVMVAVAGRDSGTEEV